MNPDRAHRRALADVNGDPQPDGPLQLVMLAVFVLALLVTVALVTGHVAVSVR